MMIHICVCSMNINMRFVCEQEVEYMPTDFGHKFRGLLYETIMNEHEAFEEVYTSDINGFVFSNLYPPKQEETIKEGDRLYLDVRSSFEHIKAIQTLENTTIHLGDAVFTIENITITQNNTIPQQGTLYTPNGVYLTIKDESKYDTYWKPEHGITKFKNRVEQKLDRTIDRIKQQQISQQRTFNIFQGYEQNNTYAKEVQIAQNQTHTVQISTWTLQYNIQNQLHRQYIKTALNHGIGHKNSIGFGILTQQ